MTATTVRARRPVLGREEPEWLVWLLVILLLAIGLIVRTAVTGRTEQVSEGNVGLSYPAGWTVMPADSGQLLRVAEPIESTLFPATVTVSQVPLADITDNPEVTLGDLALKLSNDHSEDLTSYQVLTIEPARVKDQDAVKLRYVYVTEPELAGPNTIPVVAEGEDVLLRQGDALTVVTFVADSDAYDGMRDVWGRILNSLELK